MIVNYTNHAANERTFLATLEPGSSYTIFGAAWAGDTDVTEIWVSLDAGSSWVQGQFLDPINRHAWRRWKYDWITPTQPGLYTLRARAKGADRGFQPDGHQFELRQLCDRPPSANRGLRHWALNSSQRHW